MLLLMMELKGRFNSKMIKRARFGSMYFDELGAFQSVEKERVTGAVRCSILGVLRRFAHPWIGRRSSSAYHSTHEGPQATSHATCLCEVEGRRREAPDFFHRPSGQVLGPRSSEEGHTQGSLGASFH